MSKSSAALQKTRLTTNQVADLVGVTPRTVRRWIKDGKLTVGRTAGGHARIAMTEVQRILGADGEPAPSSGPVIAARAGSSASTKMALAYLRVPDGRGDLLQGAVEHVLVYGENHGYEIVEVVQVTGESQKDSYALQRIRNEIKGGHPRFDCLLVERWDRLSLMGAQEFVRWAYPVEVIEIGIHSLDARRAYDRELVLELYWPLAETLVLSGFEPDLVEPVVAQSLAMIANLFCD